MSSLYVLGITENITLNLSYNAFFVDATGDNITITIPTNPGDGTNFMITRMDSSANTVTINTYDAVLINGSSSVSLNSHQNVLLGSFNGNWYTVVGNWLS
jgi:hypothetical protein